MGIKNNIVHFPQCKSELRTHLEYLIDHEDEISEFFMCYTSKARIDEANQNRNIFLHWFSEEYTMSVLGLINYIRRFIEDYVFSNEIKRMEDR
jgi:hypothetical protein